MRLFVATHNQHKIREISQILPGFEIVPDDPEGVEETAPDFIGNAFIKVRAIAARHPGEWCMADDSGLEVKSLGGAPGVRSARYAGEPANTPNNNALLLKNLEGVEDRTANFTCAVALVDPHGEEHEAVGKCFGRIALQASGAEGFGYDPLFVPDGHDKSFAELTADEKNAISHRGRALAKAKELLSGSVPDKASEKPSSVLSWLRLFRVVNLPTVPGDVLAGAALCPYFANTAFSPRSVIAASAASVFIYMFGLVDNDISGAGTDRDRPISDGEISVGAARVARGLCLFAALVIGSAANLPPAWWIVAFSLAVSCVLYNRAKWPLVMGLCRGQNLLCGVFAVLPASGGVPSAIAIPAAAAALVWTAYIACVTKYSEGEGADPEKRRFVGFLVGAIVYLQLAALVALTTADVRAMPLMLAGAVLLALLRIAKHAFPRVSAS